MLAVARIRRVGEGCWSGARSSGSKCAVGSGSLCECSGLSEGLTLGSSHHPMSCLLSTSPPSPQLQPGGGSGTLNLGPHQSAQRKNFGLLPLAAVTRKAWHSDPDTVFTACKGQRVKGREGWDGIGEQLQQASGMTWAPLG